MKPRQTVKNFHHNNSATTMFPCHNQNNSPASSSLTIPPALRDLDLAKLGLSIDDLPNLQASATTMPVVGGGAPTHQPPPPQQQQPPPLPTTTSHEEIVKCLQAIYGNQNTNEIMQKLPLKLNDWPIQSVSPPDYSRGALNNSGVGGSSGGGGSGGGASGVTSSSNTTTAGLASGAAGFGGGGGSGSSVAGYSPFNHLQPPPTLPLLNNNTNKGSQQNKQDPKLASANISNNNQQHLHQTSSGISPHFKMSTTNTQQQQQQQQQHHHHTTSSQQKSVFDSTSSSSPSSIVRHQHLQKLLKASGQSQMKASSSSSQASTSSRNDTFNMVANHHPAALSANIQPVSSQSTTFCTVPKSLLNLAACTSSSPSSNSTNASSLPPSSKYSSMVNQLNMISSRLKDGTLDKHLARSSVVAGSSGSGSLNNSTSSDNNNSISNSNKATNLVDYSLMNSSTPQSLIKPSSSNTNSSSSHQGNSSRSSLKQLQSLMPDEQLSSPPISRANSRTTCNVNSYNTSSKQSSSLSHQKVNPLNQPSTSKEAFLAELQERAARVGVSIGEISKPVQSASSSFGTSSATPATSFSTTSTSVIISPSQNLLDDHTNLVGRREIESALSRVEARNDLSLLFPPMLLADNSQKQINALSAGLQDTEDMELFTKEVKKIVLEECNIIYECKECSNLFRSLANLVKHKRTYCLEQSVERNNIDINKRTGVSLLSPTDQLTPNMSNESVPPSSSYYPMQKQPNLSKLLRTQPKHRLPTSRDSVLMGALTMSHVSASDNDPLAAFESDKRTSEVHEQLVRSSTLAKTLLDEKAKAIRPKQSLIELSRAESMHKRFGLAGNNLSSGGTAIKRAAPKRKFLEDCIQKVKRDKINNEDEEESISELNILRSSQISSPSPLASSSYEKESHPGHLDIATSNNSTNSDEESDNLMIDLEEPKRNEDVKKDKRKVSTAAYSSASSTSSLKMNSSSALLKALTRPIAKKPIQNATNNEQDELPSEEVKEELVASAASCNTPSSATNIKQEVEEEDDTEERSCHDGEQDENVHVVESKKEDEANGHVVDEEVNVSPPSPLFVRQTCDLCEVDYEDLAALTAHIMEAHPVEKMVYPCIFCSFSCITLENVCRHILDIHKKPKAQVHRLKEVVRSRSKTSSDFQPCSDYSSDSEVSGGSEPHDDYESNSSHSSNKKPSPSNSSKDIDLQESKTTPTKAGLSQIADPNTSGSSSTAAGGIMKLKIQLKTRPDEKSKVYEIV